MKKLLSDNVHRAPNMVALTGCLGLGAEVLF
jgi:hypothetical protein